MTTPEGKTKSKIRKVLAKYGDRIYYVMNVPGGFGTSTVDYLGCVDGWFFAVEAKREGVTKPTARQEGILENVQRAGGQTFLIHDDKTLDEFDGWLNRRVG